MPWKVTVMFPDGRRPMIGDRIHLGEAYSHTVEYVDASGQLAAPALPPRQYNEDRLPAPSQRTFSRPNLPTVPNSDIPAPPPVDNPELFDADQGGYVAYSDTGKGFDDNPHHPIQEPQRHQAWANGWRRAEYQDGDLDDDSV
jgi:hypothetical protein